MSSEKFTLRPSVAIGIGLAVLLAGGLLGLGLANWKDRPVFGSDKISVRVARDFEPVNLGRFANGFGAVVKPTLPTVVSITSSKVVKVPGFRNPFSNDPFFRQFFGNQFGSAPREERERGVGSGVIVNPDGYILTNNHVVEGASDIKVHLSDKRDFSAKVIGTDPKTDIAVLKVNASSLPALAFGDSSKLQVGDIVFAIGDPFEVGETVTMGIVSATGRGNLGIEGPQAYEDFIQTDAAINPGNSGGALIDLHGDLVGINTAILTGGGGGNQGIGFAIPVNMAHHVMNQILEHGRVIRGYLGIFITPLTPEVAKHFGLSQGGGALVDDVSSDGPAAKAGIKRGDVILAVNGEPVQDNNDLRNRISQTAPGTTVKLKVFRDGSARDISVPLGELPEKTEKTARVVQEGSPLEGVEVDELTPDIAEQLDLPRSTRGVVVTSVDASSPAAGTLQRGDVIQEVNHKPVANVREYERVVEAAGKQSVLLLVNRGGITTYVDIEPH